MIFRKNDDITKIFLSVFNSKRLSEYGDFLVLVDNCCNAPVTNQTNLLRQINVNRKAKSETLGGEYKAPMTGFSEYIGEIDLDENLGMTVLSQSKIEKMGGVLRRKDKEHILTLPGCPISIWDQQLNILE